MATQFNRLKIALTGGIAALLLSVGCASALADHGLIDAAADMKDPATEPAEENLRSPVLTEVKTTSSTDEAQEEIKAEDEAIPVNDPSLGTAVRLPGVAEKDQPRFRRQMNRTDI